jgi:hypothetical protein
MADLLFLAITVAFFAVCTVVVRLCDRVIGPDTEPRTHATQPVEPEAEVVGAVR